MADNIEKYCSGCKHDSKQISESPCNECCNAYTSKFEAKTNFDKIKEMSVDEFTWFLIKILNFKEKTEPLFQLVFGEGISTDRATKTIRIWLESEVQNNG